MIVVEGMDNSGKTTLVQQISSRFNIQIQPSLGPPTPEKAFQILTEFILARDLRVYDRLVAFSDTVYGPPLRQRVVTDPTQWTWIHRILRTQPFIIYCRPPTERVLDFGDRGQMDGVVARAKQLLRGYDSLFNSLEDFFGVGSYTTYDYTNPASEESLWLNLEEYVGRHLDFQSMLDRLDQGARV